MDNTDNTDNDIEINEFHELKLENSDSHPQSSFEGQIVWLEWTGTWKSKLPGIWGKISVLLKKDPPINDFYRTNALVSSDGLFKQDEESVAVEVNVQSEKLIVFHAYNDEYNVWFTGKKCLSKKKKRDKLTGKYKSLDPYDTGRIEVKLNENF